MLKGGSRAVDCWDLKTSFQLVPFKAVEFSARMLLSRLAMGLSCDDAENGLARYTYGRRNPTHSFKGMP